MYFYNACEQTMNSLFTGISEVKQLYKTKKGTLTKGSFHTSINVTIQIPYVMILSHIFQSLKDCLIGLKDLFDQDETRKEDRLSSNCCSRVPAPSFEPPRVFQR